MSRDSGRPAKQQASARARATRAEAAFALPPALVAALAAGFGAGAWEGVLAFVVVGAGAFWWAATVALWRVEAKLGGEVVGPSPGAVPAGAARLVNLVDGLCTAAGVRPPVLRIREAEGLNAAVAAAGASGGLLVVTSSLLAELTRVELEGVLAALLMILRSGEALPESVRAALPWGGRLAGEPRGLDLEADRAAVSLTRYPPGLIGALEKLDAKGTVVAGVPRRLAHLWYANPLPPGSAASMARPALRERLEALREL